jgi:hypothetical protein
LVVAVVVVVVVVAVTVVVVEVSDYILGSLNGVPKVFRRERC